MLELRPKVTQKQKIQQELLHLIHHLHPDDSPFEFWGLDSLAKIELLTVIEKKFGIRLGDNEIIEMNTLDDLAETILYKQKRDKCVGSSFIEQPANTSISFKTSPIRNTIHQYIAGFTRNRFDIEVHGKAFLPQDGPFIIAANHSSHLDNLVLMVAAGGSFDNYVLLAAKDYFYERRSLTLWLLKKLFNLIPFDRNPHSAAMLNNIRSCKTAINAQKNLIIFPEATRSLTGEIQPFKGGCAMLAWELQIPIIPAYIEGAYDCLPKGKVWPKKGSVTVCFGSPILMTNYLPNASELNYQFYKMITQELEQQIKQLKSDLSVKEQP